MAYDLITIGRVSIDLYPLQDNVGLEEVNTFSKTVGGSATNVAIAAAQHGLKSAVITRTGHDPFGRFIHQELDRLGVHTEFLRIVEQYKTPITFCEIFPPDTFPLYFYREPVAPDLMITADELPYADIKAAAMYWSTVTGLSREPSRSAHFAAWEARGRKPHTILDLDYRPMFWDNPADASAQASAALEYCTIAIGNREECEVAVGESDPQRAADALLERGIEIAVVKQGPKGVMAKTRDECVEVPPIPVSVVNGLGSGDGFGGAFCYGLSQGWELQRILHFANAAGAIVATRRECSTAMPHTAEVLKMMGE
jgi:5-dehydro-2-deoxygluconokinase